LGKQPLAESLSLFDKFGLLQLTRNKTIKLASKMNYLTCREKEVLQYLIKCKTANEISSIMKLSRRTIEHYTDNIKEKMGAISKSHLIAMTSELDIF
jgi:DNA-binding CsgD family transcriptional regulator